MYQEDEVVFRITRADVIMCAQEMGIPADTITEDVLTEVKDGVEWGLECWSDVVKEAIRIALNR